MIVSHDKKFVFIHVYKVAGQSVRAALNDYVEKPETAIGRLAERVSQLGWLNRFRSISPHATALQAREHLGHEVYDSYFTFAFVRNPWDWQVSLYHFMKQSPLHPQYWLSRQFSDFDDYIEWRCKSDRKLQKSFLTDAHGKLIVDYIGRFETLNEDFAKICDKVGIESKLPHKNRSKHEGYKKYYNDKTRALVAEYFAEDIEFFDYQF
ncbi:MAG: sulfotransferase family 2 domain-containing protein [Gammaproteobacteria bacterium]|nr:sulfotransferase family protein [Gammaproteobacteria bacterium]NNM00180.1 sulfotransferase family 2 domain-containing protein [Gammaproteobacteria bacterium]